MGVRVEPGRDRDRGDPGADQVGGQALHEPDDRVLGGVVAPPGGTVPWCPAAEATATNRQPRRVGPGEHRGHGGGRGVPDPAGVDVPEVVEVRVRGLPQRRPAGDHGGGGDDGVEPAQPLEACRPPPRRAPGGRGRRRRPGRTCVGGQLGRPRGSDVERDDGVPVGDQARDRGAADAARGAGDQGGPHEQRSLRPSRRAGRSPSSAWRRSGRRGRRWARPRRPRRPAGSGSRSASGRCRRARRGRGAPSPGAGGASARSRPVRRGRPSPARRRRPRPRRGPPRPAADGRAQRRDVAAVAVDEHDAAGPGAQRADQLDHGRCAARRCRSRWSGEVLVLAAGRRRRRRARTTRRAARPPAAATAVAITVSVSSGRCGPCCSSEPTGTRTSPPRSTSGLVVVARLVARRGHSPDGRRVRATGANRPGTRRCSGVELVDRGDARGPAGSSRCRSAGRRGRSPRRPGRWRRGPTGRRGRSSPRGRRGRRP